MKTAQTVTSALVNGVAHAISTLEKEGKLKNGKSAPYTVLTAADGHKVELHPRKAHTLFTKGEVDGIKLLVESVVTASTEATTKSNDVVKVTKKSQAIAIFNEAVANGDTRASVIARFKSEVGLSVPGANTYYQNVRSGKKGWA